MPRGDGTGPFGLGPMSGKGMGQCAPGRGGILRWIAPSKSSVGLAVLGLALNDISSPDGVIRKTVRRLKDRKDSVRVTNIQYDKIEDERRK